MSSYVKINVNVDDAESSSKRQSLFSSSSKSSSKSSSVISLFPFSFPCSCPCSCSFLSHCDCAGRCSFSFRVFLSVFFVFTIVLMYICLVMFSSTSMSFDLLRIFSPTPSIYHVDVDVHVPFDITKWNSTENIFNQSINSNIKIALVMLDNRIRVNQQCAQQQGNGNVGALSTSGECLNLTTAKQYVDWAFIQNYNYAECQGYDFVVNDPSLEKMMEGVDTSWSKIWTLRHSDLLSRYDLLLMLDSDAIVPDINKPAIQAIQGFAPGWLQHKTQVLIYSQDIKSFSGGNAGVLLLKTFRWNNTMSAYMNQMLDVWWKAAIEIENGKLYTNFPYEQEILNRVISVSFSSLLHRVERYEGEDFISPIYGKHIIHDQYISHVTGYYPTEERTAAIRDTVLNSSICSLPPHSPTRTRRHPWPIHTPTWKASPTPTPTQTPTPTPTPTQPPTQPSTPTPTQTQTKTQPSTLT